MNRPMIENLLYTLGNIRVSGRASLAALLFAARTLRAWQGNRKELDAVQTALEQIVVRGEADADRLMGCMEALDTLGKEEPHGADDEHGQDHPG